VTLNAETLANGLRRAVLAQDFGTTPDASQNGSAVDQFPSLDLAVLAFPVDGDPVGANVLFSREHPEGHVARIGAGFSSVQDVAFEADAQDAHGVSSAWLAGADWRHMRFEPLFGSGTRFVAPYPASLLKLMVAVGLAWALDKGLASLEETWLHDGQARSLRDWQFDMLAVSCNASTSALVSLLHHRGVLTHGPQHPLHRLFEQLGLHTLRMVNTRPDGGWGNAAGAGVGQIQMTAWDTVRLLWWLAPQSAACPWLAADAPKLSDASRAELLRGLEQQGLDVVLSSSSLGGVSGCVPGIPNQLHPRWQAVDGSVAVGSYRFPAGARGSAEVQYLHKIGNTENYSADAGIVRGLAPQRRHYLVALLSNLGSRYAPNAVCATTWRLPKLGAAIDALMKDALEPLVDSSATDR
jgi:hypothetical protein